MIYMMCYDIANQKRRGKTAKVLENFGIRVQKSFFQCDIPKEKMDILLNKVLAIIDLDKDYFFIYPLCEKCIEKPLIDGSGQLLTIKTFEIL